MPLAGIQEVYVHTTKEPCVYIMASKPNGTLYSGVTSDLLAMSEELGISCHLEGGDERTSGRLRAGKDNSGNVGRLDPTLGTNDLCAHATRVPETR